MLQRMPRSGTPAGTAAAGLPRKGGANGSVPSAEAGHYNPGRTAGLSRARTGLIAMPSPCATAQQTW